MGCITMNIQLAGSNYGYENKMRPSCCIQNGQLIREKVFKDNENANDFLFPFRSYSRNYRRVTLPEKVTAFFLFICRNDRVIPVDSNDRIYVIDDKVGFPPGLAECAIELRKKNIWVVQSRFRASLQTGAASHSARQQAPCDYCGETSHRIKEHDNIAQNSLPNTRDEMKESFQANASLSPLCDLMASHPKQIQRYVREGCFYSRSLRCWTPYMQVPRDGEVAEQLESVICAFCRAQTNFNIGVIKGLTSFERDTPEGWFVAEAHLNDTYLHRFGCRFSEFLDNDALLEVRDQAGNIMATQSYFIADPALESSGNVHDSGKSCTYPRVFVMADISEQERRQLIIPHDQINKIIHQQRLETLRIRTHEGTGTLRTAFQDCEQMLQELPSRYQQLYDSSELNRAVTSYRSKLHRIPRPRTQVQQEVLDFLADADAPLRALYAASMQLTHLLPLTRGGNAGGLTILTQKISELVAQYQQAIRAIYGRIDITNLTTLVPYELWSNCALREIGEAGNEVIDYLNRLTLDDNKLYQALAAHQMKNSLGSTAGCV